MAEQQLSTLAICWRLERRDGVTLGLTSHDCDIEYGGVIHRAAPGMTPSAIHRTDTLESDSMEAGGALTSAAINARDLLAGRWADARVVAFSIDWSSPGAVAVPLSDGRLGAIELKDGTFNAELRGLASELARPILEATSPGCRARLGDKRCRVPMAGRKTVAQIVDSNALTLTLTLDKAEDAANSYGAGQLRWLSGANCGLAHAIARSSGTTIELRDAPRFPAMGGERVELSQGCDGRFATCTGRFGNASNFRGEPHLPGTDLLIRYPGA